MTQPEMADRGKVIKKPKWKTQGYKNKEKDNQRNKLNNFNV